MGINLSMTTQLQSIQMDQWLLDVETAMATLVRGPTFEGQADVVGGMASEHLRTGGKRLRARLALASSQALGARAEAGVVWAAACELAHNATLIHDDIQDGDRVRRGQPTTWVRHGVAQAINAGDLLFMLPYVAVGAKVFEAPLQAALCQALGQYLVTVIRGQALECQLMVDPHIAPELYEKIIREKTSALFELPVFGAALIAGASPAEAARITRPFAPLGMLFQMQDDVLDLFGDKGREAPGADLREGKVSALVVTHWARHPEDRAALLDLLQTSREQSDSTAVAYFIERFRDGGTVRAVLEAMDAQAAQAQSDVGPELADLMRALIALVWQPVAHVRDMI